jgi:ribosome recycling factor
MNVMPQTFSSTNAVLDDTEKRMQKAVDAIRHEFQALHTGRASVVLVENIKVDYYNTQTPLKGLASINTPDAKTIHIQPWDQTSLGPIEKAIQASNLGLTPQNDGKTIRIKMPHLTEERRDELDKLIRKIAEEGRISIRNCRHDANHSLKKMERDKVISEDISRSTQKKVQELTDKLIKIVDEALSKKESEIKEV